MRKFLSLLMMVAFSVAMFANSYWYRGVDNSWGATAMTESTDGLYEYIQSSNNANQFKIATSEDSWDYGWTYVQAGFNSTDVTNIGDYGQDNCYCWQSGNYYILVYKPNTSVNTTANPIICASTTLPEAAGDPDQMYVWNGIGVTTAAAATELGGAAEAVQADGTNIAVGASQKGNWCLKANKGFSSGKYYLGIAMNNGVNAGDTIKIAYFRTTTSSSYVLGMDFSADKASAATTYQILSKGDPQALTSNGTPVDSIFIVPEGVKNAKYMRIYRNSGSTGLWVAKVEVVKKAGETPEQPEEPEEVVLPVVKLAGSLSSWEEPVLMANAEDSLSASLTLNLGIDHYQLKVVSDGNWLSKAGDGDLYTMHRDWNHADHLDLINTGDNIKLITDVEGAYTFTWTYADSTLVVTFPEAPAQPKFYITGGEDIVGEGNPTWGKNGALESFSDTLVMNLAAGFHKFKLITPAEQWLGMEALTDTAYALYTDGDTNICFDLAEAGPVTVIYNATEFKVEGDFYIAPVAKYYLIGDSAFVVDAGATADKAWTPDAIASFKDTTVLNLKAGVDYIMRLSLNGTWDNHRDFRHLTDTAAGLIELPDEFGNHSIGFSLAEAGDVTIIYIPAANEQPEVFKLIGNFYVAPAPDPTVAVMGSMNKWAEEIPFVLSDDKTYASLTVENIGADEYEFKFIINGEWRSNGYRFHREFTGAAGITENNEANMVFVADQEGEYTFTWFFANDSLAITYPEYIEPAKEYYAKYAPAWEWVKLTEAEGLWLTDTLVYQGIGININDKADDENNMFYSNTVEEEGVRPIAGAEIDVNDTIYFTFNPADSVVTAVMVGKYIAPDPTVAVMGSMNKWAEEIPFVLSDDKTYASLTVENIGADEYEFKFIINGEWRSNGYRFHREFTGAAGITENNEANMVFVADQEGEYTFTWFFANDSLAITYPEYIEPAKEYYAKYAPAWEWVKLTEAEGLWLTDTLVYQGIGININDKADDENNMFYSNTVEEEGVRPIAGAEIDVNDTIYFTFNPADSVVTAVMVGKYIAPDPTVAVMGSMNKWAEEIPFVLSDDKTYASLTVENIGADEYEFKFIINGEWRSNGYRFHREFTGAAGITENNDANMVFVADQDGEYTFYWYFANDSAAIVYPEYIEPAKEYYAKYAPAWEWVKLTEAEGLWLTDTIVYKGIGININDQAADENNMFYSNTVEEEGVRPIAGAEIDVNDTIYFTFNPADSVVTAVMVGKYIAPDPTVAVMGSMNKWAEEIPFVLSDDKTYASLTVENIGADEYEFKFIINGEWRSNGYRFHREFTGAAGITENNDANMVFVADQDGEYTFYWYFENDSAAIVYPAKPEPVLANGYYLVGSMNEWTPAAENLFALNPDNEFEYQLAINLDVNTAIKVVYVENDAIVTWYPTEGEDYVIDDHHNGATTVYFRPDGQGGEGWHYGMIYVVPTSTVDITNIDANAPAVKVMRNGQMFIIKGDKTYNVMGIMVR